MQSQARYRRSLGVFTAQHTMPASSIPSPWHKIAECFVRCVAIVFLLEVSALALPEEPGQPAEAIRITGRISDITYSAFTESGVSNSVRALFITPSKGAAGWPKETQKFELIPLDAKQEANLRQRNGQYVTLEGTVSVSDFRRRHAFYAIRVEKVSDSPRDIGRISDNPQRGLLIRALEDLVKSEGHTSDNHFFAVRLATTDWVYWVEERRLIPTDLTPYWESKGPAEVRARAVWKLRLSSKCIDLDTDVVPTESDIPNGSTYVEPVGDVAGIVYECMANGDTVEVRRP